MQSLETRKQLAARQYFQLKKHSRLLPAKSHQQSQLAAIDPLQTVMRTAERDMAAAKGFFGKAMAAKGAAEKVAMDQSQANKTADDKINTGEVNGKAQSFEAEHVDVSSIRAQHATRSTQARTQCVRTTSSLS